MLRPVDAGDLDDLHALAVGLDSVNLPQDADFLAARIAHSERSFAARAVDGHAAGTGPRGRILESRLEAVGRTNRRGGVVVGHHEVAQGVEEPEARVALEPVGAEEAAAEVRVRRGEEVRRILDDDVVRVDVITEVEPVHRAGDARDVAGAACGLRPGVENVTGIPCFGPVPSGLGSACHERYRRSTSNGFHHVVSLSPT